MATCSAVTGSAVKGLKRIDLHRANVSDVRKRLLDVTQNNTVGDEVCAIY